jgi:membrane protein required for colicin V production
MERLGGLICGIMQGIVVITIVVFLAGLTKLPHNLWWHESSLLPSFEILAIWLRDHVATQMAHALIYR